MADFKNNFTDFHVMLAFKHELELAFLSPNHKKAGPPTAPSTVPSPPIFSAYHTALSGLNMQFWAGNMISGRATHKQRLHIVGSWP